MRDIKELTLAELEAGLKRWGEPSFRAQQVFSWIYKKRSVSFSQMSDLSAALRKRLEENFTIQELKIEKILISKDGTQKLLLRLKDGSFVEAVSIPARGRVTGCISTQVGCKFACKFCASGLSGFKRNLSSGEMLEEALFLKNNSSENAAPLTHLVFMGTGEPLDNYDEVLKAIRVINAPYGLNIGARRITISTCGIIPGIEKLAREDLQIELSVSLHAADEKIRSQLMPVNLKYPLRDLIPACRDYIKKTNRQVTFEYILMRGINSDLPNAKKLSTMMRGLGLAKVNLIPGNPIKESVIVPPGKSEVLLFRDYLLGQGVCVTLRKPRGEDIEAACGQLRLRYEKE